MKLIHSIGDNIKINSSNIIGMGTESDVVDFILCDRPIQIKSPIIESVSSLIVKIRWSLDKS